jgi:curved DNA-binding protein CbpA
VNHYVRLKVAQDAPAEVIRAAYRALATKLHPDRQGPGTGQLDSVHEEMALLNAAYEVLIDPKLRADYDATLVMPARGAGRPSQGESGFSATGMMPEDEPEDPHAASRVDFDWLTAKSKEPAGLWPPSRRMVILGGSAGAVLLGAFGAWMWDQVSQHQMDDALSYQYRSHVKDPRLASWQHASAGGAVGAHPGDPARRPTVEELSRMSDEELLRALPTLDGQAQAPADVAVAGGRSLLGNAGPHPLDGTPLVLRSDRELVDPLAPDGPPQAGSPAASAPAP